MATTGAERGPADAAEALEAADGVVIRPYRPGDETAIVDGFNRVFPWARRTVETWRAQFARNPDALRCEIAVGADGAVLAQFAGLPRRVRVDGAERSFSEIVDSFVDSSFRRGLKKPGLFARTAYAYIDRHCRPDGEAFAYGLPNPDALRLGGRLLGYAPLSAVTLFVRDAAPARAPDDLFVDEAAQWPADFDGFWERFAATHPATVVRDRRYLEWRYARPGVAYRRFFVRDPKGVLVAAAVLRPEWLPDDFGPGTAAAAEWMVDARHPSAAALPALLPSLAARLGARRAACVVPPVSVEATAFDAAGFRREPTKFLLVGRTYDPAFLTLERARTDWYWTLGDFDVI
ncbi:MAG TPA: hypothetical protein VEI02_11650 [Planctomycetota bacterium]|nr:hypothetical protein [Planctomycetota bacterium]